MWVLLLILLQNLLLLAGVFILIYLAFVLISFRNKVPYVPTPRKAITEMIELANIKKGERVCDLGSGTGRIIIAAAKAAEDNLIVGIEKSTILKWVTKIRLLFHPSLKKRIQLQQQDFFNLDLQPYDVIFCFLTPEALRLLTPKFKILSVGSRLVSYMFALDDYRGFSEDIIPLTKGDNIYLYKKLT